MLPLRISIITSLYNCETFLSDFFLHVNKLSNIEECELVLIHNQPTTDEMEIVNRFIAQKTIAVNHIIVPRENLYASWNRGIEASKCEYLAVWNVDDIRTEDSLKLQITALDKSGAAMCYGDFYSTYNYGENKDHFWQYDNETSIKNHATRFHIIGCFQMWRKSIHDQIGYYDEQFKLVGDFDFQLRVIQRFPLVKSEGFLGYYLDEQPHKLTSNTNIQRREHVILHVRHKIYSRVLFHHFAGIKNMRFYSMNNFGNWIPLKTDIPEFHRHSIKNLLELIASPFYYLSWGINKSFCLLIPVIHNKTHSST